MNSTLTRTLAAVVAACALQAAPAYAQQMQPAPSINVEGCAASAGSPAMHYMGIFGAAVEQPAIPPMLMIAFKAQTAKPLSSIDFGVVRNGKVVMTVRDVGTFSPDAVIMHAYGLASPPQSNEPITCVPLMAKYTDGSSWMNPTMPAH
jgi:hypothetical protein